MDRYMLPATGELVMGLWSDRWARYPGLADNNWADSSAGMEFFIGREHYAVVFVYGHMGVFYDPTGDCKDAKAVCQYKKVSNWSEIAANSAPIILRLTWTTQGNSKSFKIYVITASSEDTEPRATITNVNYLDQESLRFRFNTNVTDLNKGPAVDRETLKVDFVCLRSLSSGNKPELSLNRQQYYFGVEAGGGIAGQQLLMINNSGGGTLNWRVGSSASWLLLYPAQGTGNGEVSVSINAMDLVAGEYIGTITAMDTEAVNSPQVAQVRLRVYAPGASAPPFGQLATPEEGMELSSSIPVTGWVLDDMGIQSVKIYHGEEGSLAYIGDALLVEGARPDVELAYPGYPMNDKAGWGYMLLSHFLPGGGNGTYHIHALATDLEGHTTTLGSKTIYINNNGAVKPFGALDTPGMGGLASGTAFINWGWALTPQPNKIPTHGTTISVYVDGVLLGHPVYNNYREDIATLFPGYSNSFGAAGYFYLDTTDFENGVHTIQWTATDSGGNTDGIGSRYFSVYNPNQVRGSGLRAKASIERPFWGHMETTLLTQLQPDIGGIVWTQKDSSLSEGIGTIILPDHSGIFSISLTELERLVLQFPGDNRVVMGYLKVGNEFRRLPVGSTLDSVENRFCWEPGPGFIGLYTLVFILENPEQQYLYKQVDIRVTAWGKKKGGEWIKR